MPVEERIKLNKGNTFWYFGIGFVVLGFSIILISFLPIIGTEIKYVVFKPDQESEVILSISDSSPEKNIIVADNPNFSIVVPKIGANAPVVANVDPFDAEVYQQKLTEGVAHAEGSVFPGQIGTTFLFAHSSVNFYEANRYNSVFYLLSKLIKGDRFSIVYGGEIFDYTVTDVSIVSAEDVDLVFEHNTKNIVKLMTCWPAGTNLKRLVVEGELK